MPSAADIGKTVLALTPKVAPYVAGGSLRALLEVAIEGYRQVPGAKTSAKKQLQRLGDHEAAISALVVQHIAMAGAQGFLTNLGGLVTAIFAVPANIAGLSLVQCRIVAAIAHLRGYDVDDDRVRSSVLMCLLGETRSNNLVRAGELPSTPLGIATAPVFDPDIDFKISQHVMNDVVSGVTGKRLGVFATKKVPLVGGGVGLAIDSWTTRSVAHYARTQFVSRRPR